MHFIKYQEVFILGAYPKNIGFYRSSRNIYYYGKTDD